MLDTMCTIKNGYVYTGCSVLVDILVKANHTSGEVASIYSQKPLLTDPYHLHSKLVIFI